jgi:hypothetical protein
MEDLHHQVVLVNPRQILISAAWTAFVNKPSCANHALSKLIVATLYIELRYLFQVFIVLTLNHHSLHRWNGTYFEKTTLCNVGLTIQLNHASEPCPLPVKGPADFVTKLVSISVAVASPLEKTLPDISSCFGITGFLQLQNHQKLSLPSQSSKYFIS